MRISDISWFLAGLAVGALIALISIPLGGMGHRGWSAAPLAAVSLFAAPLAGVSYARRDSFGPPIAALVLFAAFSLDFILFVSALGNGGDDFVRVWRGNTEWILLWAALLASWQLLAARVVYAHWNQLTKGP